MTVIEELMATIRAQQHTVVSHESKGLKTNSKHIINPLFEYQYALLSAYLI